MISQWSDNPEINAPFVPSLLMIHYWETILMILISMWTTRNKARALVLSLDQMTLTQVLMGLVVVSLMQKNRTSISHLFLTHPSTLVFHQLQQLRSQMLKSPLILSHSHFVKRSRSSMMKPLVLMSLIIQNQRKRKNQVKAPRNNQQLLRIQRKFRNIQH